MTEGVRQEIHHGYFNLKEGVPRILFAVEHALILGTLGATLSLTGQAAACREIWEGARSTTYDSLSFVERA